MSAASLGREDGPAWWSVGVANGVNPIGVRLAVCLVDGNGDGYLDTTGGVGIRSPSKKESSGGPLNGRWTWGNP